MDPAKYAKDSEHSQQVALFMWAAQNVVNAPELKWLHAIPNGATFGDDAKSRSIRGGRMKAEGLREGVSDVFLPCPRPTQFGVPTTQLYHGLYIEMKKPAAKLKRGPNGSGPWDHGGVSDTQKEFLDYATAQGYKCVVCYDWIEAAQAIKLYLTGNGFNYDT